MATAIGSTEPPVIERLQKEPYRFNFYQLIRLLEMMKPEGRPLAMGSDPSQEPVRLHSTFSLGFPASDVVDWAPPQDHPDQPPDVTVSCLGLGGANGPLPHVMTEWVLERSQVKDFALRDFLDIFNHRLLSLLYRVHRESRLGAEWVSPEKQHFTSYLLGLLGMLTDGLGRRLKIPDRALLRYAGLLTKKPRDASGLQSLLTDYFSAPVNCRQLCGAMRQLDKHEWTTIGSNGRNHAIGLGAMLGTSVWDQEAGIEVEVGPVPWAVYLDFLPGHSGLTALCQMVRFYIGPSFDVLITLQIEGAEIPPTRLGKKEGVPAPSLGLTTFLSSGAPLEGSPVVRLGAVARYSDEPQRTVP